MRLATEIIVFLMVFACFPSEFPGDHRSPPHGHLGAVRAAWPETLFFLSIFNGFHRLCPALSGSVLGPSGRIAETQGFPMVFAAFRRCGKATLLQHLFVVYGPAVIRYFDLI